MGIGLYLTFVAATVALMLLPGPNVALIVATSLAQGRRHGLIAVAGTSAAMVPQLTLVVLGMVWLTDALAAGFVWLRWLGAAYLIFLGLRSWREAARVERGQEAPVPVIRPARASFWRGFVVSACNPKTLFFYGAFFPQFVDPAAGHAAAQLTLLAVTFVLVAISVDSGWALLAAYLAPLIRGHARLRLRLTGAIMAAAGLGLALARRGS